MAFSPTNPPNCHSAVLLKERKTGTWRTAVVRLVCRAQQKVGCIDVYKLLTSAARIGRVVRFSRWQDNNLIRFLKTCMVPT